MKLGILSALWHRPELTVLFLDRLEHLKKKFDVIPLVVGTEGEFRADCGKRGILYVDHENRPLGSKWNKGMQAMKDLPVTNIMILGSDDFVSDDFIEHSLTFAEDKDFCGCMDLYMFSANRHRSGWAGFFYFAYQGWMVGPGRCYSRELMDKLKWSPWGVARNSGLDGSIAKNIKNLGIKIKAGTYRIKDKGLFMVDIKTYGNISGIPGGAKLLDDSFEEALSEHFPFEEAFNLKEYLKSVQAI